jgi:hypothetical protein
VATQKHREFSSRPARDYLTLPYTILLLIPGKRTHDRWLSTCERAGCGLTAMIGNRVGGPGDYLPTERLADDLLAGHSFWVYNKAGVVTPLSAWARHNCGALTSLGNSLIVSIARGAPGDWISRFRSTVGYTRGSIRSSTLGLTAPLTQIGNRRTHLAAWLHRLVSRQQPRSRSLTGLTGLLGHRVFSLFSE